VGSAAQTKAMKKVSGKIKLELAQFRELEAFMQFASDLDEATKKQIDSGRRMTEVLKQKNGAPLPFEMEAAVIYAATNGYFDRFAPEQASAAEEKLQDFLLREGKEALAAIRESKNIADDAEAKLKAVFDEFAQRVK
jgi:F-type H+-transporting ATPase subunit alpha